MGALISTATVADNVLVLGEEADKQV